MQINLKTQGKYITNSFKNFFLNKLIHIIFPKIILLKIYPHRDSKFKETNVKEKLGK